MTSIKNSNNFQIDENIEIKERIINTVDEMMKGKENRFGSKNSSQLRSAQSGAMPTMPNTTASRHLAA